MIALSLSQLETLETIADELPSSTDPDQPALILEPLATDEHMILVSERQPGQKDRHRGYLAIDGTLSEKR